MPITRYVAHRPGGYLLLAALLALGCASDLGSGGSAHQTAYGSRPDVTLTAQGSSWNPFARKPGQKGMIQKAGDSTWSAIKGTGNAMKKGVNAVNPWHKKPDNTPITGVTKREYRNKEKEQPSSGWFSWMRPKPKPQPPQTVTEWLNQKRPEVR